MIGAFLKARRQELDISQSTLISRLNLRGISVTKAALGHWELNRNNAPINDEAFRVALAAALEMSVNTLMERIGMLIPESERSDEALRAADIIDRLPCDAQKLALEYLDMLDRHYTQTG